ncbi:MAG: IS630 family transposase [Methyloprofundus sp.]|nr:IS630 family transposase [Methyloprofundus sp.]
MPENINLDKVEIWFQDEARVGQRGTVSRIWAEKGTRPRIVQQQQFTSAYIFGAVCPENRKTAGLIMPKANTEGMQHHLDIISSVVTADKHALLIVDRAAWHLTAKLKLPTNITIMPLPAHSPELNPVEQIWQQLRRTDFSNRSFKNYDEIVSICCKAWNKFAKCFKNIYSLCSRQWAILE